MRERIEKDDLLFDQPIIRHGYADHMRDYDVLVEPYTSGAGPGLPLQPAGRWVYVEDSAPARDWSERLVDGGGDEVIS